MTLDGKSLTERSAWAREALSRLRALTPDGGAAQDGRLALEEWGSLLSDSDPSVVSAGHLMRLADEFRERIHPDGIVTYVVDRNINYSNVCSCVCSFCAFSRSPDASDAYVLSHEQIFHKVEEMLEVGGSGILMQGGLHPDLPLRWYTDLLSELKKRYGIHLHCFSPTEIHGLAEVTSLSYRDVLIALKTAGLDSMPGGGAEILVEEIRRKRRSKVDSREWLEVMETAHELGIPTTATMMFGHGEKTAHRLEHLEKIRALQDRTGGFVAFIPWTFQPDNTALGRAVSTRLDPEEYLLWLAVSRLYLDNIPNIQVSWLTQGLDTGRHGLRAGANDMGSTMIEENVIRPAGAHHEANENMLRQAICQAGFRPMVRNAAYVRLFHRGAPGDWSP